MTKLWLPKECTIKIDAAADVTLSNTTVFSTAFASATAITGQFKDININQSVGDANIINLLGVTSQNSTDYQNAEMEETPSDLTEISGTIIVPGDEMMESEIFGGGTAASSYTTYEASKATKTKVALAFICDDGTDAVAWAITNAIITEYNPSFTGPDGHLEASVTFKCLPRNALGPQFKD